MREGTDRSMYVHPLRYGRSGLPELANMDESISSGRNTVMLALCRATCIIREYLSDSSSKHPLSSVFSVARGP